ncbi:MAG TPA: hypothetical protein VFZ53_31560 [Polyangiaceae bacterium]
MTDVRCEGCQAVIEPASIDWQRELASCAACGRLVDLRRTRAAAPKPAEPAGGPRARATLTLPDGMSMSEGRELVIRRRWLRRKHWFLLLLFASAAAYVAYLWATLGVSAWLVVGTLFVVSWNVNLAAMFLNSTVVTAGADGVTVRHGPMPSLFARNTSVRTSDIQQLYAAKFGAAFAVEAKLVSGGTSRLVAPLVAAEQALFIEQRLERALGIADAAVDGELGDVRQGAAPAGAASGAALALLIPAFIVAMSSLFYFVSKTEVSGQLRASGSLGSWTFEPDDCVSGQREGFGGVVLTASAEPGRVVRVVRDPVRGSVVVVAERGRPNHVLAGDGCAGLVANVERTSTNINDIWVVEGNVALECPELGGTVTFAGCH